MPGDWALNINGNHATIYGGEIEAGGLLGGGFELAVSGGYTHAFVSRLANAYVAPRYSLAFPFGYSLNGRYIQLPSYDLTNIRAELESLFQEDLPSASFNRIVTNQPLTAGIDMTYRF